MAENHLGKRILQMGGVGGMTFANTLKAKDIGNLLGFNNPAEAFAIGYIGLTSLEAITLIVLKVRQIWERHQDEQALLFGAAQIQAKNKADVLIYQVRKESNRNANDMEKEIVEAKLQAHTHGGLPHLLDRMLQDE